MKIEDIRKRVDELINIGKETALTQEYFQFEGTLVNNELFAKFRTSTLSFIKNLYGTEHPYYENFYKLVKEAMLNDVEQGLGILGAILDEVIGGWLYTVKGLVSAEIFSDFLEMAEHLLKEGYKDPAAVMIGSVLEEHLRQLCQKNNVDIVVVKGTDIIPKKADAMNVDLCKATVYNMLDQKQITSWLDLRNKAAHGKYSEYTKEQVDLMYQGVLNFISRIN